MTGPRYRVGLVGHGIGPSLTPELHMQEARHLGLDYRYELIDLSARPDAELGEVLAGAAAAGLAAVNVTHPFKQGVLSHVRDASEAVRRIGSANLVLLRPGGWVAHNTDYAGFLGGLETFLGGRRRGRVLQVGAGGAGLATACALVDLDFEEVVVHDRSESAAADLVERFGRGPAVLHTSGGDLGRWLSSVEGVVHATPTGMAEHPGVALDVDSLPASAWVAEVVYRPLETALVRRARDRGLATLDGGAMAVGQAVESIRLITGREPDVARMHAHFDRLVTADRLA